MAADAAVRQTQQDLKETQAALATANRNSEVRRLTRCQRCDSDIVVMTSSQAAVSDTRSLDQRLKLHQEEQRQQVLTRPDPAVADLRQEVAMLTEAISASLQQVCG